MYNVFNLTTQTAVTLSVVFGDAPNAIDPPAVFPTADDANECAQRLSLATGQKHVARPVPDTSWRERERAKFDDGTYQHLPWITSAWHIINVERVATHYAHYSVSDAGMVAYVPDEKSGQLNRHVRLRAGAYLQRFFADVLSAEQIRDIATDFNASQSELTLHLAKTSDEIEHVYMHATGFRSCMDKDHARSFDSTIHPVRVYGAGDLALAYIRAGNNHITARVVCWPDRKVYSRIYGDFARMERVLKAHGYKQANGTDFDGAKLLKIEERGGLVLPYIDFPDYVTVCDDCLRMSHEHSDVCGQSSTSGIVYLQTIRCYECGDAMHENDATNVHLTRYESRDFCETCYQESATYCDYEGIYVYNDSVVYIGDDAYSAWWFERHGCICERSDENILRQDSRSVRTCDGVQIWSNEFDVQVARDPDGCPTYYDPDYCTEIAGTWYGNDTAIVEHYLDEDIRLLPADNSDNSDNS